MNLISFGTQVFAHHGLTIISPLNQKFNPNFHEALFEQVSTVKFELFCELLSRYRNYRGQILQIVDGKSPGTVVVVSKPGYKLNDRVIRPALVGVSKSK